MAYFDSLKNKALWEKEMEILRPIRAEREANGFQATTKNNEEIEVKTENSYRKQINLEQLHEAMQAKYGKPEAKPQRERAKQMKEPKLEKSAAVMK